MRKLFTVFLMLTALVSYSQSDLVLTAVFDADLSGGLPKGVEVYATDDIADLSLYGLGSANNGGGSDGEEFTFPAVSVTKGSYIYVTTDSAAFNSFFGFNADYIDNSSVAINGDDAVELFHNGTVADVYGDINVDGSGETWEYQDSWSYRINGSGPDGSTWTESNWNIAGPGELDGELTNGAAANPVPVGTYSVNNNFNLTFQVDMSQVGTIANTVSVAGNFQVAAGFPADWTPGDVVLTDPDNDLVYTTTVSLPSGSYEFKYLNGASWGTDESVPSSCAVNNNRGVTVNGDTTLDVVCFGSCTACATQVDLTLRVDMSDETVDPTGVFVAGSFQGWSPGSTSLTDIGNGIYEVTVQVQDGSTHEYKFINGTNWESVPSACGVDDGFGGFNREVSVSGNTALDPVKFGTCVITSVEPEFIDINTIRQDAADGTPLYPDTSGWIKGVVFTIDFDGNNGYSFYIDDNGAGMNIWNFSDVSGYQVQMGDSIHVHGSMAFFNGLSEWQADSIIVASTGNELPEPMVVNSLGENTESQLIRINDVYLADPGQWPTSSGSVSVDIVTQANDTLTMRIDSDTDIDGEMAAPTGTFDVIGVGGQFDGSVPHDEGYQILPRMQSDIIEIEFIDINTIRQDAADGTPLYPDTSGWIKGVVFTIDFDGNNGYSFYIDDNGAGMNIWNFSDVSGYQVQMGDSIHVHGSMAFFNGLSEWQADSIIVASTGNELPEPMVVNSLGENTESQLIRINDVYLANPGQWPTSSGSASVDIVTQANDTLTMRIDSDTDIDGEMPAPTGLFKVIGVGGQFDGSVPHDEGYQILPRMQSDIFEIDFIDINTIREDSANGSPLYPDTSGWIKGVVYTIDYDGNNGYSFYIQDHGAGMNIWNFNDVSNYQVQIGDSIHVHGSMAFFNGLSEWQADSIVVASSGNDLPVPMVVNTFDESTESQFIRINQVYLADTNEWPAAGSNATVNIVNSLGDTLSLRIDRDTDIDGTNAPQGLFDVQGAGGQFDDSAPYDEGYQILPRFQADIIQGPTDTPNVFFSVVNISVDESAGTVDLTVSLTDPNSDTTMVDVVATGGTATAGSDYNFNTTTVVFPPLSATPQTVTVDIIDDNDQEGDETIIFELQNPTNNANILIANATVTIEANDKPIPVYEIDEVNNVDADGVADSLGVRCELRGVVTTIDYRGGGLQFWIQDPTAGMNVFSFNDVGGYTVTRGDSIHVIGEMEQFNGLLEIIPDSIALISQGNEEPAALEVDTLIEEYESEILVLNDVEIVDSLPTGGGYNMQAVHDNDTIIIRVDNETDLYTMSMPMGYYRITGVGSQFDGSVPYTSGYQLQIRSIDDFEEMMAPNADFDYTITDLTVEFEDRSSNYPETWFWEFGDGNTADAQNPTYTFGAEGSYEVCLTVSNSQGNTQFCDSVTVTLTGISSLENDYGLEIFPVPTENNLTVQADIAIQQIEVFDASGRVVLQRVVNNSQVNIHVGNFAKGMYLVKILTNEGIAIRQIIKE